MSVAEEQFTAVDKEQRWECKICRKVFSSLYILNYHRLLEHSHYKRPPIGVG
ncbi:MAG TPA: hypothetical protein VI278_02050 [Nitrososphaeraceae archaeon]